MASPPATKRAKLDPEGDFDAVLDEAEQLQAELEQVWFSCVCRVFWVSWVAYPGGGRVGMGINVINNHLSNAPASAMRHLDCP